MPLFIPYCFRSNAIVPLMVPAPVPAPSTFRVSFSALDTPRIVKSPSTSKVSGPVCTIFFERNVMVGFCLTSKKSLPFNLLFFIPLPVSTLLAWILMSSTPLDTSADMKVSEASHWSKEPLIATDASTSKVMELSTGTTLKTGTSSAAWALLVDKSKIDARTRNKTFRTVGHLLFGCEPPTHDAIRHSRLPNHFTAFVCTTLSLLTGRVL